MQKKVIALAIAGLVSGGAFAQSNVTIYGVMDAYTGQAKADNAGGNRTQTVVNSGGQSSSRLGFKGEEALGNGLKSIFVLELGSLAIDGATNSIGNTRQAYVGLSSDKFGTATLGRHQTIGYDFAVKYDPLAASTAFSALSVYSRGGAAITRAASPLISASQDFARQPNAMGYISPVIAGGLVLRGNVAFTSEQVTGTTGAAGYDKAAKFYSLGGDYSNGPLSVALVYVAAKDMGVGSTSTSPVATGTLNGASATNQTEWALGGIYDFKFVKPFLTYQEVKYTTPGQNDVKSKIWSTGLNVPVTAAGVIKLGYANYKNDVVNANAKSNTWTVLYDHSLSKRTNLYAGYTAILNGANADFRSGASSGAVPSVDKNVQFYGMGIRHTF